jgi:hypothetical protein
VALTLLFLALLAWRTVVRSMDALAIAFLILSALFLFYSLNYRTLNISLTRDALKLRFGIFARTIPLENVVACRFDDPPVLLKCGGAGIHFMLVRGRYRASFNFLEYSRVVIALRRSAGPVRDVSFTTQLPDAVIRLLQEATSAKSAA